MQGGQGALKSRKADEKDEQVMRLKAKIGELTMANELLEQKVDRMENGFPLPRGGRSDEPSHFALLWEALRFGEGVAYLEGSTLHGVFSKTEESAAGGLVAEAPWASGALQ